MTKVKIKGKPTFMVEFIEDEKVRICGEIYTLSGDNMLDVIGKIKKIIIEKY